MTSSLIPEKPLIISPSLAATIGLEEATMLSLLADAALYQNTAHNPWLTLEEPLVQRLMPFWGDLDIQRISRSLADKGIIQLKSAPYTESRCLMFAFDEHTPARAQEASRTQHTPQTDAITGARLMAPHWQPDAELMRHIAQYNVPEDFVRRQVPEFVAYWRERAESHHAWGAKFLKHVIKLWREQETESARRDQETAMHNSWRPSRDALEVLVKHANISLAFIEDAIPEFVLYWHERGEVGRTWNSKFIQHVKRQWLRYNSALEHDTEPRRIPENWQPSQDVYDVVRLANIDIPFAQQQVPEFVLYWRDSNQLHSSWNTKFLQHVKYLWSRQHALASAASTQVTHHAGQQASDQPGRTRDRSLVEDLTDRSWAS